MKHYLGERTSHGCEVDVLAAGEPGVGYALPPRHDLRNHSTGFSWGIDTGSSQLALALLADALGDDAKALKWYVPFNFNVITRLPDDKWELSEDDIKQIIAKLEAERRRGI